MPAGWMPGDPIPLPHMAALQQAAASTPAIPLLPVSGPEALRAPAVVPVQKLLQRPQFDASFLMLDNDDEEVEEDFSSEEESDDE